MNWDSWEEPTLFAEDSPAKTYPWPADVRVLLGNEPACSGTHSLLRPMSKQNGSSWRTCQDFYQATKDAISESSLLRWPTQGIATSNGEFWTRSSSEFPNVAVVCLLQGILEEQAEERYSLSARACAGILRRSSRRGKTLPEPLAAALEAVAGPMTPIE